MIGVYVFPKSLLFALVGIKVSANERLVPGELKGRLKDAENPQANSAEDLPPLARLDNDDRVPFSGAYSITKADAIQRPGKFDSSKRASGICESQTLKIGNSWSNHQCWDLEQT